MYFDVATTEFAENGRGCGDRQEEAPYACCGVSTEGVPIEAFVIDPAKFWPTPFQRSFKILPRDPNDPESVNDLMIFVGEKAYPSPWDFVMEAGKFGSSRKMPDTLPFELLTPYDSRQVFIHSKAIPLFEYTADRQDPYFGCEHFWSGAGKRDKETWDITTPGWHTVELPPETQSEILSLVESVVGETPAGLVAPPCAHALRDLAHLVRPVKWDENYPGNFTVEMPSLSNTGREVALHPVVEKPTWHIGIFMALPLTHFEFCKKADPETQEKAEAAGFQTAVLEY